MNHPPPPPPPPPSPPQREDPPWPDRGPEWRHDAGDPDEAFAVPFTLFDALGMVLWSMFANLLVGGLAVSAGIIGGGQDPRPVPGLSVQIVAQVVTLSGIAVYLRMRGVLSWRIMGPLRPRRRHVLIGAGLGLAGLLLTVVVSEMVNRAFGPYEAPEQFALQVSSTSVLVMALAVVTAVILAPVVEEVVFRSLLFQSVRRKFGLSAAMVISSLVFAFMHTELLFRAVGDSLVWAPNPPGLVGLIALALWLAGAFHLTGSLVVPVAAHATYNATVLVLQVAFVAR